MRVVDKAFAYITWRGRLLVFDHVDFPDAGLQVPAGTIQAGETPEAGVIREAREETGLLRFLPAEPLGIREFDTRPYGKKETHRRHFFHLRLDQEAPERWRHDEANAEGDGRPIRFELYWVEPAEAESRLAHAHGALLHVLLGDRRTGR